MSLPMVVAITGATGVIYGIGLLRALQEVEVLTHLVLSESAIRNIALETDYSLEDVRRLAKKVHNNKDIGAAVASGSFRARGMIVAPCSIKTLSAVASSFNYNLVVRAADVTLKERRPLVLMVRESPLHKGHLDLMSEVSDLGGFVLPPVPAFYHAPQSIMDLIHQSVGKALDLFDIEHSLFARWTGEMPAKRSLPTKGST